MRSEARIFTSVWDDPDFATLPASAQRLYLFLVSQKDLSHLGTLVPRPRRWAGKGGGLTETAIVADLATLAAARYVVVDDDAQELLVRSLLRRDEVWRQPNLLLAARKQIPCVESTTIRTALADELVRVLAECELSARCRQTVEAMLKDLSKGSAKGSEKPSPTGSAKATRAPSGEGGMVTAVTKRVSPFPAASRQPPDPAANPSPNATADPSPPGHAAAAKIIKARTGCSDAEAAAVLAGLVRDRPKTRNLAGLVTTIANDGDLPALLADVRARRRRADVAAELAAARAGPECVHGTPGGEHRHPDTNRPLCPQCRRKDTTT